MRRLPTALAVGLLLLPACASTDDEIRREPLDLDGRSGGIADDEGDGEVSDEASPPSVPGLVVYRSEYPVSQTAQRLEIELEESDALVTTIDHAANASEVGVDLDPIRLVIGGTPQSGTPIVQANQEAGLDLPQRYLVWQDGETTFLAYDSAEYIAVQAELSPDLPALDTLRQSSADLAATATGTDQPVADGVLDGDDDVVEIEEEDVDGSFRAAAEGLDRALGQAGLSVVATVDHVEGARELGQQLPPTVLTLAGNPEVGTTFLEQTPTIGIDLPQRFLVTLGTDGEVAISYSDFAEVAERHGISGLDAAVERVEDAQERIVEQVAGD